MFENRVLREMFGSKRDEVIGKWRRLQSDELYYMYFSPNIIRTIQTKRRLARHVASVWEWRDGYGV